jgi:hypothetical protein
MRLALVPGVDVEKTWRDVQPLDLETLEPGTFSLLPLVYRRLHDADVRDSRLQRLAGIYRSNWVRNQLQVERLPSLLEALKSVGVEPLVVGGPAIAARYYAQLGLRPVLQLELLVSPSEGASATAAISEGGWRPAARRVVGQVSRFHDESSTTSAVLYEGLSPYVLGPVDSTAAVGALRQAAAERAIGGASALTLAPADELLLACASGARRTIAPQVQWLVDAHHILMKGDMDEARLVARARAHRLVHPLREILAYLVGVTAVGTAASGILRALDRERPGRRDSLTYRLAANGLGPLGSPPEGLLEHARRSLAEPLPTALRSLPSSMRDAWDLEGVEQVPLVAARKILGRMRRAAKVARLRRVSRWTPAGAAAPRRPEERSRSRFAPPRCPRSATYCRRRRSRCRISSPRVREARTGRVE